MVIASFFFMTDIIYEDKKVGALHVKPLSSINQMAAMDFPWYSLITFHLSIMKFNSDRHHRRSIRLKGYDYSTTGAYFATICARNHECLFTRICRNVGAGLAPALSYEYTFPLSDLGEILKKNWQEIENDFSTVYLDAFIIMPNHIHGIIVNQRATARVAPTLGRIIGSFKSKCSVQYLQHLQSNRLNDSGKIWQRNYYEHIIRNEEELNKIRKYIAENPTRWHNDKDNPVNLTYPLR